MTVISNKIFLKQPVFTPIFIMSSERSGSNLLRMLLDNHPDVHGPRAPQLLKTFAKTYPYYFEGGKLVKKDVINDIQDIVNHPYVDWKIDLKSKIDLVADDSSFMDLWSLVYGLKAEQSGVSHIACKENDIFDFAPLIKNHIPNAKFLYLHRDVRDVSASWMKMPIGFKNLSQASQNWNREQLECIRISKTFGLDVHRVPYEDLLANTPKVMTGVLEYIGLDVNPLCFETNTGKGKSQDWNVAWKNLSKKVMKDNTKKYLKQLNEDELLLVETRAREAMNLLGYKRDSSSLWEAPRQSVLNRVFSRLAFATSKPKYSDKEVDLNKMEELKDFTQVLSRVNQRRRSQRG